MIVGAVRLVDAGPQDPDPTVEAAELLGEVAGHQLVLEAPRRAHGREGHDLDHAGEAAGQLVRVDEGLACAVVDRDEDDWGRAARREGLGDHRRDLALAEDHRCELTQHRGLDTRECDERTRGLGRVRGGVGGHVGAFMHHEVLYLHTPGSGRDPNGARALASFDRDREAEQPAFAALAEQIGRSGVRRDACDEPRLTEPSEAIEAQRPLAVEEREVIELHAADQQPREVSRTHEPP